MGTPRETPDGTGDSLGDRIADPPDGRKLLVAAHVRSQSVLLPPHGRTHRCEKFSLGDEMFFPSAEFFFLSAEFFFLVVKVDDG